MEKARLFNPKDHTVIDFAIAPVDDFDHMITGLPKLAAVFPIRRHKPQKFRAIGVSNDIVQGSIAGSDANIEKLAIASAKNVLG